MHTYHLLAVALPLAAAANMPRAAEPATVVTFSIPTSGLDVPSLTSAIGALATDSDILSAYSQLNTMAITDSAGVASASAIISKLEPKLSSALGTQGYSAFKAATSDFASRVSSVYATATQAGAAAPANTGFGVGAVGGALAAGAAVVALL